MAWTSCTYFETLGIYFEAFFFFKPCNNLPPNHNSIKGKAEITSIVQTGFLVCKTRVSNSIAEFCLDKWRLALIGALHLHAIKVVYSNEKEGIQAN